MGFKAKLEHYKQQLKRAESLEETLERNKDERDRIASLHISCNRKIQEASQAPGLRKKGIIFLVIGIVLLILEIMLLTETVIVGYSDFDAIDLVIIGIPLVLGIRNLKKASDASKCGNLDALHAEKSKLENQLAVFKATEDELSEIEESLKYHGREWDFSRFYATPETLSELEQDFEDLLIVLKHNRENSQLHVNCWLSVNVINQFSASVTQNQAATDAHNRGHQRLRDSGSWIGQLINGASSSMDVELLIVGLKTDGEGLSFADALKKIGVRAPANEDEQALWDVAHEEIPYLVFSVGYELKKSMN